MCSARVGSNPILVDCFLFNAWLFIYFFPPSILYFFFMDKHNLILDIHRLEMRNILKLKIDQKMTSRRIVVKADVRNEDADSQHPRVGEKQKYFDLVTRSMSDVPMNKTESKHPRVRKTVGSVKLTESVISESTSEEDTNEIAILTNTVLNKSRKFPEHLFNIEPTQIDEITDTFIFERILEEAKIISTPKARKKCPPFRAFMKKLIPCKRMKEIPKENKKPDDGNELLPEDEYQMLQEHYLRNRLTQQKELNIECESKKNTDEMQSDQSTKMPSPQEILQTSPSMESSIVEDLDIDDNTDSIQSNKTLEKHPQNSLDIFSQQFRRYSEQRFIIDKVLSDFSLRNKTILTEAPVWIEDQ